MTEDGAKNQFELDIIFAVDTDFSKIRSPINESKEIFSALIENIIINKISTCHRFAAGNTRIKDYDGLWRLSKSFTTINSNKVKLIAKKKYIHLLLDTKWIGPYLVISPN